MLVMGQRVTVVVVGAAAAGAAGDDQVIAGVAVKNFMIGRVHLFSGQKDDVSDAVHTFRGGYIILAQMSLLEHD